MVVAKLTSKNQLTPLHPGGADVVRTRLAELGISEADVGDADLLAFKDGARPLQILTPGDFRAWLATKT